MIEGSHEFVKKYYDQEAEDYIHMYKEGYLKYPANAIRLEIITKRFLDRKIKTVLDVGCGTCGPLIRFLKEGLDGKGCDFSEEMVRVGREQLEENGFKVLLVMRLVGIPIYDVVNFGSGLTKIKFRDYFLASLLGMIPGGLVLPYIGSNLNNLKSPKFILGILAFILLMFIPKIYKKFKKGDNSADISENTEAF